MSIRFTVFVDVQLRKESHQNAFHIIDREKFIWQRSNQAFSPLLCQARFSHQHEGMEIVDCQIYLIVLKSLDTLLEPGNAVRDALSTFPLELVQSSPDQLVVLSSESSNQSRCN